MIDEFYKSSLALLTDLYQLTMSYGYFKKGRAEDEAVFHLFFRKNPFKGNYTVTAGLHHVIEFLKHFRFREDDLAYLRGLKGSDNKPLFSEDYLEYLSQMKFTCDVDAVPEGRVVFPHEPMLRISGPIIQGQLLETALLNILNFQTLIATKASRISYAAEGDPVLEFGLRRAQGIDGAMSASRASYIGGIDATSHVLAGKIYDIPVKGTHAHSWVMSFPSELEAFETYAEVMPNNCVFLVDTYNTVAGVKNAIRVGEKLRAKGFKFQGIRLDSGDLVDLSIKARYLLDEAGFQDAAIVASNDLDEYAIQDLKKKGAKINIWGVGTKLVTGYDCPALGGVYKVAAVRENNQWVYKMKISEEMVKISNPGLLQVRRYFNESSFQEDVLYNLEDFGKGPHFEAVSLDGKNTTHVDESYQYEDLLKPIFRKGKFVYQIPTITESRESAKRDLKMLKGHYRELSASSENYPVMLEMNLNTLKKGLMAK
jgi:nicotinate phosphoribosyltransferase